MEYIISFIQRPLVRRIGMLILLGLVLYLLKDMINIILITFILAFIMNKLEGFIQRKTKNRIHPNVIYAIEYIVLAGVIILSIYYAVPNLIGETVILKTKIVNFLYEGNTLLTLPQIYDKLNVTESVRSTLNGIDISSLNIPGIIANFANKLLSVVQGVYSFTIQFFLAYILSLFLLIQKTRLAKFGELFEKSKIAGFYVDCKEFFKKFINTFGVILQNQVIVSAINTILSLIGLYILGYQNLIPLCLMIFVLGLIPIAGVLISCIPLTLVTLTMVPTEGFLYTSFGVQLDTVSRLLFLLLLGTIIHTAEAYVISPKLLSDKIKLPIFIVICVLIICEHYFKIWGLIVGIPIFVFIIDLFGVDPKDTLSLDSKT